MLWTSRLSCGCWTSPVSRDGHPYGRAPEGSWISCVDDLRHQAQYRVLETRETTEHGGTPGEPGDDTP